MKKIILFLALAAIGAFAIPALAGQLGTAADKATVANATVDPALYQKFMDETQALRDQIILDRAELDAVMAGTNPDPAKARAITQKIVDARNQMRVKAKELGLPAGCGMGDFMGRGHGMKHGKGHGMGYGMGRCGCPNMQTPAPAAD